MRLCFLKLGSSVDSRFIDLKLLLRKDDSKWASFLSICSAVVHSVQNTE